MKSISVFMSILASAIFLTACGSSGFYSTSDSRRDQRSYNVHDPANEKYEKHGKYDTKFKGTIVYYKSDGGHYMISSDNGVVYRPANLPSSYRQAGLRVRVTGTVYRPIQDSEALELKIEHISNL
jgi:hypothetical protein